MWNKKKKLSNMSFDALNDIYFSADSPGSFRGARALYQEARRKGVRVTLKEVSNWLSRYDVYTKHKPIRHRYPRLRTVSYSFMDLAQADLGVLEKLSHWNKGYKYILVFICVLSKMLYLELLKKKTASATSEAFQNIFNGIPMTPMRLQTDLGGEFWGKPTRDLFLSNDIHHFSSESRDVKAAVAEVMVREVKRKIYRIITMRKSKVYWDIIPDIERSHNSRKHPGTGMAPQDVSFRNAGTVFKRLYPEIYFGKRRYPLRYHFKVGDKVRITMKRDVLRHSYYGNWLEEVFRIVDRLPRDPVVYRLESLTGDKIRGVFYRNELVKVLL